MITMPLELDYVEMFDALNRYGICDNQIEHRCEFAERTVSLLRRGKCLDMTYRRAARIYNLWVVVTRRKT